MRRHRAVLFDVDGVLLDTGTLFRDVWCEWARSRSLDPDWVVALTPGRRTTDVLRELAPGLDPAIEHRALDALTRARLGEVRPVPGAGRLLQERRPSRWAIVTSGSRWFVTSCFRATGLPLPGVAVYDEDVRAGKPSAEGYLAAAGRLGVPPAHCLVVEDSPSGVAAARSAGCTVIAVTTTEPADRLGRAHACLSTLDDVAELLRETADG
jgi:mannitol-1-/sugar-/sorbitol-6-phosphatase